jgi:hypothetical protein
MGARRRDRWIRGRRVQRGPEAAVVVGYGLPRLPLVLELEVGVRHQSMSTQVGTLGVQTSSLTVFPIELALRWEALSAGTFRLGVRGGAGLLVGTHHLSSTFDSELSEGALGWEVFAALQAGLQVGPVEPYIEVRPSLAKVSTDHLEARPGGGSSRWCAGGVPVSRDRASSGRSSSRRAAGPPSPPPPWCR